MKNIEKKDKEESYITAWNRYIGETQPKSRLQISLLKSEQFIKEVEECSSKVTNYEKVIEEFISAYNHQFPEYSRENLETSCILKIIEQEESTTSNKARGKEVLKLLQMLAMDDKSNNVDPFVSLFSYVKSKVKPNKESVKTIIRQTSYIAWLLNPRKYIFFSNEKILDEVLDRNKRVFNKEGSNPNEYDKELIRYLQRKHVSIAKELFKKRVPESLLQIMSFNTNVNPKNTIIADFLANMKKVTKKSGATNIILYGVAGSGKSWKIKELVKDDEEAGRVTRIIFHPEYTYFDFVGQMMPKYETGEKEPRFIFKEGPLSQIIKNAIQDPWNNYYLIIEEINRGNTASIFGDLFQLLDRKRTGESEFKINNAEVAEYIYNTDKTKKVRNLVNRKVFLPQNLSIIATMNTADQNVCPLDTAFQRRWHMLYVKNDFNPDTEEKKQQCEAKILDTDVTWKKFCMVINSVIHEEETALRSTEDKCLGLFFMRSEYFSDNGQNLSSDILSTLLKNSKQELFVGKVIKYLWDDAFKFNRKAIFSKNKFDDIAEVFTTSKGNSRFAIFIPKIIKQLVS